jgi:hypothetical protein
LQDAWITAWLQRVKGDKFPRKPSDLWAEKKNTMDGLLNAAKALKAKQDKEARQKAKGLKARDVTILREE